VSSWAGGLARAAAAPAACAAVLIGLLSAWVSAGGAGTVARVRIEVTLAAIPMPAGHAARPVSTRAYLTIRNLSGRPDELTGARSPAARRVTLSPVAIPAHGTVTLTPFGADLTLIGPGHLLADQHVPLTLFFRHAGRVTIQATVTAPGTP
jgi:copper(I)-binding protein